MTSSRARDAATFLAVVGMSAMLSFSVGAQQSVPATPVPIQPNTAQPEQTPPETLNPTAVSPPQPLSAPRRLVPNQPDGAASRPNAPTNVPNVRRASGIEIDGLQALDIESVGTLSAGRGGIGSDLWRGLRRSEALDLVNALPKTQSSQSLLELMRRFMLTQATAPVAVDDAVPSLMAARAAMLLQLGLVDATRELILAAPTQNRPASIDRSDAMVNLLAFDNARVCGLTRNNQQSASDFWLRLSIYCDVLDGDADKVAFGLTLLRETAGDDPAFSLLADAVLSETVITLDDIEGPHPVHIALSRIAEVTLPESVAESSDPLVLYAVATYPNFQLGTRIEAAERGVAAGTLDAEVLRRLYLEVGYAEADIADSLTRAQEIGGPAARALLYQAAVNNNIAVARGEIIVAALSLGREDGRYVAAVEAFRPLMDRLPPSPELVWFAPTGVRAYLTLGEAVGTERWLALLRASAAVREETKIALDRVRPLASILGVGGTGVPVEELITAWRASLADDPALTAAEPLIPGLLLAFGEDIPVSVWPATPGDTYQQQPMPPIPLWFQFRDEIDRFNSRMRRAAPQAARLSDASQEAVAIDQQPGIARGLGMTLQILGSAGPESWSTPVLFESVRALRTLGLAGPARRLALEYLLAAGL